MTRSKTYTPELREEAVKLVLTQGLTLEDAALRLTDSIRRKLVQLFASELSIAATKHSEETTE